jgi:hypothetical protein
VPVSKGQYWAIKQSLSKAEKDLINFYELQWHLRHRVPSIEEVATQLKIPFTSVSYYLRRTQVQKGLKDRGIPWEQQTQEDLTATQVAAAVTMMNFTDTRSNDVKLDQLGVNPSQYYAWLNDPQFKNLVQNLADQNLNNIRPTAIGEFTKLINKGDWQAVKYYLDVTGALTNGEQPQSEQLIKMIIEILQDEIKDSEVIVRIAQRIKNASLNKTLEIVAHPQITADFEEVDLELEEAKKKLGVL